MVTEPCGVLGSEPPICAKQHPDTAVKSVWQISYESGVMAKFDSDHVNLSKGSEIWVRIHASFAVQGDSAMSPLPLCARQKLLESVKTKARQSWVGRLCLEFGIRFRLPSLWVPVTF